MEYSITPSEDGKYILIVVRGKINGETAMKITLEAHAMGREMGIDKFLQDLTECRNQETETHNYTFARKELLQQKGFIFTARLAMLVSEDDHSHDFVATVAHNSGLDVRLFHSRGSAIAYLLEEKVPRKISTEKDT